MKRRLDSADSTSGFQMRNEPRLFRLAPPVIGEHRKYAMFRLLRRSGFRATVAQSLLAAVLVLPFSSVGHFVCTKGMVEAGPACPMCHGAPSGVANACCKWVEDRTASSTQVTQVRGAEPPAAVVGVWSATSAFLAVDHTLSDPPSPTASPPSSPRTTQLRL